MDPLEAGDFFRYGATAVYRPLRNGTDYEDYILGAPGGWVYRQTDQLYVNPAEMGGLFHDRDIAYIVSQMESFRWQIPSEEQLIALRTHCDRQRAVQCFWKAEVQ